MKPPGKRAAEALAESPIAGLLDQARLLDRVSSAIAELSPEVDRGAPALPPLRCAFDGRTVVITVATPSQAAKLRQRAAALDQLLRERVPEVTGFRIRLQPGGLPNPDTLAGVRDPGVNPGQGPEPPRDIAAALRFANDLADILHDSPLRRSALRLQASLRARLKQG